MICRLAVVTVAALAVPARADGLAIAGGSARAIGRAGVGTVGDDGGGALIVNPAAMARRDSLRAQLALGAIDDTISWDGDLVAPRAIDQSGSRLLPMLALEGGAGDWTLGIAALTTVAGERGLRRPGNIPPSQLGRELDYRYTGTIGALRRDTLALGVAHRIGDAIAIGVGLSASRIAVREVRSIWASAVPGRQIDPPDPRQDVELTLDATERVVPAAVAGVLVAPPDTHVELGASVSWAANVHAGGDAAATGPAREINDPPGIFVDAPAPTAHVTLYQPVTVRTGARWLADSWVAELGADLWIVPAAAAAPVWELEGVRVVEATGAAADVKAVPSRLSARTHGAVRAAFDVELLNGFLWATGGYAFQTAGTPTARQSPTFGDLGGHTLALGLEVSSGGYTVGLGWSRTWAPRTGPPASAWRLDNPLAGGDAPVPTGSYDGSTDLVGISIDAELRSSR